MAVRSCKIYVLENASRFLLLWQCAGHIRNNSILRRDRHRLSRQHVTHILRADRIERAGLRCKDIGIVTLSDAKWLKTIRIPCSDQLSRAHDHKRIRSLDLATGASHRFLHRTGFQALPCDMVGNDLRVNGGLENSSCIFQIMSEFRRIDQVTVVRQRQSSLDIVEHQRLRIFSGRRTGCRIAHMSHADIPVHGL